MGMISRDELKAGDHIYSWRTAYIYSHHGIYVGEDTVIHFTPQGGSETGTGTGTGTFLDKIITSQTPNYHKNPCLKCGNQPNPNSNGKSVVSSCLDCFLAGGNLYLFEYNLSWGAFLARLRGGTCTTATCDSPEEVVYRANYLFSQNGFGDYSVIENNCEHFAIYCKTSLVFKNRSGGSGQVTSVVGLIMFGLGGIVLNNFIRLTSDIGVIKDFVVKVSVETLVLQMNNAS